MKKRIYVGRKEIINGFPGNDKWCPIALAISKVVKNTIPSVTGNNCIVANRMLDLPPSAILFINMFDSMSEVTPFSFTLDIPDEYLIDSK